MTEVFEILKNVLVFVKSGAKPFPTKIIRTKMRDGKSHHGIRIK